MRASIPGLDDLLAACATGCAANSTGTILVSPQNRLLISNESMSADEIHEGIAARNGKHEDNGEWHHKFPQN